jgi:hypothetical protein
MLKASSIAIHKFSKRFFKMTHFDHKAQACDIELKVKVSGPNLVTYPE